MGNYSDSELLRLWSLVNLFSTSKNTTRLDIESIINDDASWVLSCSFLILTTQTGFATLECGCVSARNIANIMIKNVVDVSLGGLTYWLIGYGLAHGPPYYWIVGSSKFAFTHNSYETMGGEYTCFFYQLSFANTASTIVSGSVAERMNFDAYMMFVVLNTIVYSMVSGWVWNASGWLKVMGFYDFAGACAVDVCGGTAALTAALVLGPRRGRYDYPQLYEMSNPVMSLMGMFMLIWAWSAFNSGSTFGVQGVRWKISALVAATTMNGAIGGALVALIWSSIRNDGRVFVRYVIYGTVGGLVGVTGCCAVISTYEALLIGMVAAVCAFLVWTLMDKMEIDDPVGSAPVHLGAGAWGTIATGIFAKDPTGGKFTHSLGLLHGGGLAQLGLQVIGMVAVIVWTALMTFIELTVLDLIFTIRLSVDEEINGADYEEHDLEMETQANKLMTALSKIDDEDHLDEILQNVARQLKEKPQADTADKNAHMNEDFVFRGAEEEGLTDGEKGSAASSSSSSDSDPKKRKKKKKRKEKERKEREKKAREEKEEQERQLKLREEQEKIIAIRAQAEAAQAAAVAAQTPKAQPQMRPISAKIVAAAKQIMSRPGTAAAQKVQEVEMEGKAEKPQKSDGAAKHESAKPGARNQSGASTACRSLHDDRPESNEPTPTKRKGFGKADSISPPNFIEDNDHDGNENPASKESVKKEKDASNVKAQQSKSERKAKKSDTAVQEIMDDADDEGDGDETEKLIDPGRRRMKFKAKHPALYEEFVGPNADVEITEADFEI